MGKKLNAARTSGAQRQSKGKVIGRLGRGGKK